MENQGFIPSRVQAGETLWIASANTAQGRADIIISGYLPATHTLAYQFASATPLTVAAVTNGSTGWTLEVTAAQTLAWKPGTLRFAGYATETATGRIFAVDAGSVIVDASPLSTSAWTAVVTQCDAGIAALIANPARNVSVDGQSFGFRDLSELTELRAYAKSMADSETANRMPRIIRTRFT